MVSRESRLHCFGKNIFRHVRESQYIDRKGWIQNRMSLVDLWTDRLTGFFQYFGDASKKMLQTGQFDQLPIDHLTDHAPTNYCIYSWNNLGQVRLEVSL